jgi:hypothetical protein
VMMLGFFSTTGPNFVRSMLTRVKCREGLHSFPPRILPACYQAGRSCLAYQ